MGNLIKLRIAVCTVKEDGTVTGIDNSKSKTFRAMLNPSTYTHGKTIQYSGCSKEQSEKRVAMGASKATPQFKNTGSETLSFDLIVDGTGVVEGKYPEVKDQLAQLNKIVYMYEGDTHEPNIVRIIWGKNLSFDGRLTSMSTKYTLFQPSGAPLRATVSLSFTDYTSIKEEALKANKTSPDLTHLVEVKAGDSLPLLCNRIYRNSAYYLEVAKHNGITNFRNIKPGTRLHFPPLR